MQNEKHIQLLNNVKERLLRMLCHLNKKNNAYKYFQENYPELIEEAEERNLQK